MASMCPVGADRAVVGMPDRERAFWDDHVPSLDQCLNQLNAGPDANTALMLDLVGPLAGKRVLDFGCGVGVTAAWAAQKGAIVTGIDISPASIERARQLAERAGLSIELVAGEMAHDTFAPQRFDAVIGRFVLHHVDLQTVAPMIRNVLVPGGNVAFVETMGLNPFLRFSRRYLVGRAGIARYGTDDEHPLTRVDLAVLRRTLGPVGLQTAEMKFLRLFDRNVLRYRLPRTSRILGSLDDAMSYVRPLNTWSYAQVVSLERTGR